MYNFDLRKYLYNNSLLTEGENLSNKVSIVFSPEPFVINFSQEDFETPEEFESFKARLAADTSFAYETFFNNFDGQAFEDAMDNQDQSNWNLEVK